MLTHCSCSFFRRGAYQERKRAERKEMWAEKKRQEKLAKEEEALEGSFVPNAIIAFSFETAPESLKREDIKEAFGKHAIVNWVDYSMGGKDGFIRLEKDAKEVRALSSCHIVCLRRLLGGCIILAGG